MKRVLFCLPAILCSIAVIALNIILRTFSPLWYVWAALLWLGGILLSKGKVWGGLLSLLPAVHLLYMGTQYTGQAVDVEMPLGISIALYALACMLVTWKKRTAE